MRYFCLPWLKLTLKSMILKLVTWPPWPPLLSCNTFKQRFLFDHKDIFHNSMCPAFWPSILFAWYQRLNSSCPPINREKRYLLAGKFHGRLNFNYSNWNSNILKKARQTGRRMARCCIKHPYIYNTTQELFCSLTLGRLNPSEVLSRLTSM